MTPAHPLFDGVDNLDDGLRLLPDRRRARSSCAQVVGCWSNNEPLVGARAPARSGGRMRRPEPVSAVRGCVGINWLSTSDAAVLMANALDFAGTAPAAPISRPRRTRAPTRRIEATGPPGAAFTVTGVVADPEPATR